MLLKKNLILNTLLSVSNILFPLLSFPYASQILKPDGMGAVAYVDSFTSFFILLAALGIPMYGVREVAKVRNDTVKLNKLVSELVLLHLVATIVSIIIFLTITLFNPKLSAYNDLCFIGIAILALSVIPCEWIFIGLEQFSFIVPRTLALRTLAILLLFVIIKSKDDILLYYSITLITTFLTCCINWYYLRSKVNFTLKGTELKKHIRPLFYILGSALAISAYTIMDTMLLGTLSNTSAVGYYSTAVKLNKIPIALLSALSTVIIPQISLAFKEENSLRVKDLLKKSFEYMFLLSIPISVGLFVLAPNIIILFAGEEFAPAIPTMRIVTPMAFILGLSNIFGMQILMPLGKERLVFKSVAFGMIISIIGNLLIVPIYSHNGAATVTILVELLVTTATGYFAMKSFRFPIPTRHLANSLASATPFIFIVYLTDKYINISLTLTTILDILLCVTAYFLIQFLIFRNTMISESVTYLINKIKR